MISTTHQSYGRIQLCFQKLTCVLAAVFLVVCRHIRGWKVSRVRDGDPTKPHHTTAYYCIGLFKMCFLKYSGDCQNPLLSLDLQRTFTAYWILTIYVLGCFICWSVWVELSKHIPYRIMKLMVFDNHLCCIK